MPGTAASAWRTTQAISPRSTVRVATVDATTGAPLNSYTDSHPITGDTPPETPWAIHLTDTDHRYRLLAFDLDAKTPEQAARAHREALDVADMLTTAGLQPLICASGPTGGRHVWAALGESIDAATIHLLAEHAKHLYTSLDLSSLLNPATGCLRPPGAPHRSGSHSTILHGNLDSLLHPTGTAAHIQALTDAIIEHVGPIEPALALTPHKPLPLDDTGHPHLPGPRRRLPTKAAAALKQQVTPNTDASAVLWRILIGAAAARWRFQDVADLARTAPGMEHARSQRVSPTRRTPRAPAATIHILTRQWAKAVAHVVATPRQHGDDPTFDARAATIAAAAQHLQTRANASVGRWATRGGPSDRRILDALTLLALTALKPAIEADTRRLALMTGISRETARVSLHRLAADGWITQTRAAEGPHAPHWHVLHTPNDPNLSQADPRPPEGAGTRARELLLASLSARLADVCHDLFTHAHSPGILAGNLYAHITHTPRTAPDIAAATGTTPETITHKLHQLAQLGVIQGSHGRWKRTKTDRRDAAARKLGLTGRLAARQTRYARERVLWAWWRAELAWMKTPGRHRRHPTGTHHNHGPTNPWDAYPPMPRTNGTRGRVVWDAARAHLHQTTTPAAA